MRNGKENQKSFCGMLSLPVLLKRNFMIIIPMTKYATRLTIALHERIKVDKFINTVQRY